jgi:23S rRNA pseudouridine955/2504/2580 synthase
MKKFTVKISSNLKDFTDSTYPQGSFYLSALLRAGDVKVNGERVKGNVQLSCGDEVVYYTSKKQEEKPSHFVVYEDENILVADKLSGVSCEGLTSELQANGSYFAVHRLDRNTCGLIVYAKNNEAERVLLDAFRDKDITKTYLCFAKNRFKKESDYLTSYLKKDEKESKVTICDEQKNGYAKIVTEYKVLKKLGDYALCEVTLHTGKTHQIRAHLAHIGCPVLGDEKYGDEALNKKYGVKRQILVAKRLKFNLTGTFAYLNAIPLESTFSPTLPTESK